MLVASSILESGSTVTGTFTSAVIVKPDPGYASDPGHAGTGTVVGVAPDCPGGF